ncbi:hypothetical protein DM02DRAFT_704522 [Periconia macrospinosa]|uniref:F-box domain-containing protein n=1 Tax=Periconia macrospinosa TaxID=97972 RepID=A0A2V1DUA6_9PLEO|nr:hypothetical protein DM02DRAFT_704522 [Periconia macrospinosa]
MDLFILYQPPASCAIQADKLPEEILDLIASYSSQRALWALSQTCRKMYRITLPYLYKSPIIKGTESWAKFLEVTSNDAQLAAMIHNIEASVTRKEDVKAYKRKNKNTFGRGRKSYAIPSADRQAFDHHIERMLLATCIHRDRFQLYINLTQVFLRSNIRHLPLWTVLFFPRLKHLAIDWRAEISKEQMRVWPIPPNLHLDTLVLSRNFGQYNFTYSMPCLLPYLRRAISKVRRIAVVGTSSEDADPVRFLLSHQILLGVYNTYSDSALRKGDCLWPLMSVWMQSPFTLWPFHVEVQRADNDEHLEICDTISMLQSTTSHSVTGHFAKGEWDTMFSLEVRRS